MNSSSKLIKTQSNSESSKMKANNKFDSPSPWIDGDSSIDNQADSSLTELHHNGNKYRRLPTDPNNRENIIFGATTNPQSTSSMLDDQISKPSPLVLSLTFLASISGFMFGYDTGYISSVLVTIGTDLENRFLTIGEKEFITSGTSCGALLGAIVAGIMADLLGRKATIVICNILFIIGAGLQFIATKVYIMIIGRVIMGLGVGIGSLIAPLYIGELAPGKYRDKLVIVNCLAITGGQLVAYAVGAFLSRFSSGWRYIIGLSLLPCIIQLVAFIFLPDTPRYLIGIGQLTKARKVLQRIYIDARIELIDANINELQSLNKLTNPGDAGEFTKLRKGLKELFSTPSNIRALIIGCGLQATQQLVGFNSIMYFSGTIFEMVGYTNSTGVSVIIAGTNFAFTILALIIIDKVGRRNILLYTVPFIFLSQVVCAISFYYLDIQVENGELISETLSIEGENGNTTFWKYTVMVGLVSYVAFYATGLGNVPWQQGELFPQSVRGLGSSFATATNWSGSMLISLTFLSMMEIFSPTLTFLIFGFITLCSLLFLYLCYPELSGFQLEEISDLLSDGFHVKESIEIHKSRKAAAGLNSKGNSSATNDQELLIGQ